MWQAMLYWDRDAVPRGEYVQFLVASHERPCGTDVTPWMPVEMLGAHGPGRDHRLGFRLSRYLPMQDKTYG